jgi:histone H2A
LQLAIRNDEELNKLLGDGKFATFRVHIFVNTSLVVISQGGVVPHIAPELLPTGTKRGGLESQEI